MNTARITTVLSCALGLAACSSQVGPGYEGEPLATVQGLVSNDHPDADAADLVVFWFGDENEHGDPGVDLVHVEGSFPAKFKMDLFEPPSQDVLGPKRPAGEEARTAYGMIFAITPDTSLEQIEASFDADTPPDWVVGAAERHLLVYAAEEVRPGTFNAEALGGPLSAGFHVFDVVRHPNDAGSDWLAPSESGLNTEIHVRLAPWDELDLGDLK